MLKARFFSLFILSVFFSFAQKETNVWCFGRFGQIDFNSGNPVASATSAINTFEGCASICDAAGNLLFYTDGSTVWDKSHIVMPNGWGLWGNTSSTQSGVIIPKPGSSTIYYVFSVDAQAGNFYASTSLYGGVSYSIVDLSLNGGKGDITIKNQPLLTPTCEKLTAVMHCNGKDIWVITHEWNSNAFHAFLVTSAGIAPAIVSNVGSMNIDLSGGYNNETIGYMKASPNGKKLAYVSYSYSNTLEIFDFCNATGVVSNPIKDNNFSPGSGFATTNEGLYGISFSPDNSKLYASWFSGYYIDSIYGGAYSYLYPSKIFQYDLNAGSSAAIIASRSTVVTANKRFGALQIASNGKIYIANDNDNKLDVLNNPNGLGSACGYQSNAVILPNTMSVKLGLPDFIESYFNESEKTDLGPDLTLACGSGPQILNAGKYPCGNFLWSTGETTQSITVNQSGTYWVNVGNCFADTIVVVYQTNCVGPVVQGVDTNICSGSCASIKAIGTSGTLPYTFNWSNGNSGAGPHTVCPLSTTAYTVTITDASNKTSTTVVNVVVNTPITVSLSVANASCNGINDGAVTATVNGGSGPFVYLWSNGGTTNVLANLGIGNYIVTVTDSKSCNSTASAAVIQPNSIQLVAGSDQQICLGQSAIIKAVASGGTSTNYTYTWLNLTTNDTIGNISVAPAVTTKYIVSLNNGCGGTVSDTVIVFVNALPTVNFTSDVLSGCAPLSVTFSDLTSVAGGAIGSWIWDFGDGTTSTLKNPLHTYTDTGIYSVQLKVTSAKGCTNTLLKSNLINVWPSPQADFNSVSLFDEFDNNITNFTDASTDASSWNWTFDDNGSFSTEQNPIHNYSDTGTYNVKLLITNRYGCKDSIEKTIDLYLEYSFFIPNAFTPNFDNINDLFQAYGRGIKNYKMLVFDRWGIEVFSSNDITKGWDGRFNGNECQQDVYVYKISILDTRNTKHEYVGGVTLIR